MGLSSTKASSGTISMTRAGVTQPDMRTAVCVWGGETAQTTGVNKTVHTTLSDAAGTLIKAIVSHSVFTVELKVESRLFH